MFDNLLERWNSNIFRFIEFSNKIIISKYKKTLRFEKYSQIKTTKYMYSEILENNFKNICSLKEGIDLLSQIKNSKKFFNLFN